MPILNSLEPFFESLGAGRGRGVIVGIDPGKKRIGIAVSDRAQSIAFAADIVSAPQEIYDFFTKRQAIAIVVGLPRMLDGTKGIAAEHAEKLASKINEQLPDVPILLWEEWYSTKAMEKMLIDEVDMSRAKRKKNLDKLAAAFILQGVLDAAVKMKQG